MIMFNWEDVFGPSKKRLQKFLADVALAESSALENFAVVVSVFE